MYPEIPLAITEYEGVQPKRPIEKELIDRLKDPTRLVARLDNLVNPGLWYGQVFEGDMKDPGALATFKEEFTKRAQADPRLLDPFSFIDGDWQPRNIATVPEVKRVLGNIKKALCPAIEYARGNPTAREYDSALANYLEQSGRLLPGGKFDELMDKFVGLPSDLRLLWMTNLVEYEDDPLRIRTSAQGLLAYLDPIRTVSANDKVAVYRESGGRIFGESPLEATVYMANYIMAAGYLSRNQFSGFNIPNNPTKRNVIMLFPNKMEEKNKRLSQRLSRVCGVRSVSEDIEEYTLAHEVGHGYRHKDEQQLGAVRGVVREAWASDRALLLAAGINAERLERVVKGYFAYGLDDVWRLRQRLTEPRGWNQPSLEELLYYGSYTASAYFLLRPAFLEGVIRGSEDGIDIDKACRQAEERDKIWDHLAMGASETEGKKVLTALIDTKRYFVLGDWVSGSTSLIKRIGRRFRNIDGPSFAS